MPPSFIGMDGPRILALSFEIPPGEPGHSSTRIHLVAYDPVADRWTDRGPLDSRIGPMRLNGAIADAVVLDGDLYWFGYVETGSAWDLAAWRLDGRRLQGAVEGHGPGLPAGVHPVRGGDGRIYLLETPSRGTEEQGPQVLRIYDPSTDRWVDAPPIPTARSDALIAADPGGGIYVIGGTTVPVSPWPTEFTSEFLRSVERYEPSTDAWTTVTDTPFDLGYFSAATVASDGAVYVVGLEQPGRSPTLELRLHRFDPVAGTWSMLDVPPEPMTPAALYATEDGRLILFGAQARNAPWQWHLGDTPVVWVRDLTE
jgi:N-acetylneuraminic acid mutarotase